MLAYATTIHKSQGSEYPAVVIPVTTQHYTMLAPPEIVMDEATRTLVTRRWAEYGLRSSAERSDEWSGQGEAALRRLLGSSGLVPGTVDPKALRAGGVPALGGGANEDA